MSASMPKHPMSRRQATGQLEAVVAITDLPAEVARALLPPGLEPWSQGAAAAGRQPLILVFGEHRRVGLERLPFGLCYRELVIGLPFVRPRHGPPGPFCHLPLLLLDRQLPTLLGRWLYGFAKRRATIRRAGDRFEVDRRSDGAPLLAARARPTVTEADLEPVRSLLEQPLISRGRGDRWRYARFDFGLERARLEAVEAEIRVHPDLLAGLPAGPIRVERAFRLATEWTLGRL
jgi:Acetoacetate decarboxylase (ADC)